MQCVLAARIFTVDFVVCTLYSENKKSGQVSICRIGPFPCKLEAVFSMVSVRHLRVAVIEELLERCFLYNP
jgi:hypothetical protein